jgi:hypothetical protein
MTKQEFERWQAITQNSQFRWTEDEIYRLNGRGAFYYHGGEDGIYIRIQKDGMLEAGNYEGAIPHIGEAFFEPLVQRQCRDFNEAYTLAMEAGGKQFFIDMLTQPDMDEQKTNGGKDSMHRFQSGEVLRQQKERLNQLYPAGTRIELHSLCNDERDMPPGLRGTVMGMDDQPALLMQWDNSRSLSLFPEDDDFRKLTPEEIAEEQAEQRQEEGGINLA